MNELSLEIPNWMTSLMGKVVFDGVQIGTLEVAAYENRVCMSVSYFGNGRRLLMVRDNDQRPVAPMNEAQIVELVMFLGPVPPRSALQRRINTEEYTV